VPSYNTLKIGLKLPEEKLKQKISKRLHARMKKGMAEEAHRLRAAQAAQVMPSSGKSRRSANDDSIDITFRIRAAIRRTIYPCRVFVKYRLGV